MSQFNDSKLASTFVLVFFFSHVTATGLEHPTPIPRRVTDALRPQLTPETRLRKRLRSRIYSARNGELVRVDDADGDAGRPPTQQLRVFGAPATIFGSSGPAERPPKLANLAVPRPTPDSHPDVVVVGAHRRDRFVQPVVAAVVVRRRHQRQQRHDDAEHGPVQAGGQTRQRPRPDDGVAGSVHPHGHHRP